VLRASRVWARSGIALLLLSSAGPSAAASLLGESLVFRAFASTRLGGQVLVETAAFEVGAGLEHALASAPLEIDVSDAAITLRVADSVSGLVAFIEGTTFEFEIVSDQRFASASFDLDASTCCVVQGEETLSASRLDVQPTLLRIDMGSLGGASGQTIVAAVQLVPEPRTAALIAVGLLALSVRSTWRASPARGRRAPRPPRASSRGPGSGA
jgi:hypothetical protein